MKQKILSTVLCCLMVSMNFAQDWVTFTKSNPEPPIINLIQSNNQQVGFNVEVCGMFKNDLTEEGEPFQRIEIPGAGKTMETGSPELPYIRQLIAIPECDDVNISVNISSQTNFNNYNIYPAPDYEEVQDPSGGYYVQEVFTKDETIYSQDIYLPGMNAEIVSFGYLRDQKYAEVFIYPIQFNPVLKHIEVFTNYQITLDFINPTTPVNVNTGIFNNVATNTMLNYVSSGLTASINDNVQGNGNVQWISLTDPDQADNIVADYLIICADTFFEPNNPDSEVLRIANHRATYNGFDVAILNAKTIYLDLEFEYYDEEYMYEQKIRSCIRRIYEGANAQHTYDGKLGYVLLIGDSEYSTNLEMPTSKDPNPGGVSPTLQQYSTDYYYSCLTKNQGSWDYIGDLFIGRFCVDNDELIGPIELFNLVSKTIYYESEATFGGWRDEAGVLIHEMFQSQNYMQSYFNFMDGLVPSYFTVDKIDASVPNPIDETYITLNDGVFIFTYMGHGDWNKWSIGENGLYTDDLINNLVNTNKFPIVHGLACTNGYYDGEEDCFGERLTTYSETEGFTGYFGPSRDASIAFSSQINNPPNKLQELLPYSIFHNLSHVAGEYILETKIITYHVSDDFGFNFLGDPALNVMAQGFEVTHNIELPENTTISNAIVIKNGAQLKVPSNGQLFFENDGSLTIEEGATLRLMPYATITGNSYDQYIKVEGNLIVNSYSTFKSIEGTEWEGVILDNLSENYYFNNNISFENCYLKGQSRNLTVNNSSFINSGIFYEKGNLIIQNSSFDNSMIEVINYDNPGSSDIVEIHSGCNVEIPPKLST